MYELEVQGYCVVWLWLNCKNSKFLALMFGVRGIHRIKDCIDVCMNNPTTTNDVSIRIKGLENVGEKYKQFHLSSQ